MSHTDDAYAAMLLTMALSPDREEYVRPLSTQEFRRLEARVRQSDYRRIGALLNVDISGLMMALGIPEEEGYRLYTLLHRDVPLSYALQGFLGEGIDVLTPYDAEYPRRLTDKLKDAAPPFLFECGQIAILQKPCVAILGVSGVRTTPEARKNVEALIEGLVRRGYAVITGGEMGVSRLAAGAVLRCGGDLVEILGGALRERVGDDTVAQLIGTGHALVMSAVHPDALFTVSHAIARNRLVFALSDAAFVFNSDGRRGETEALTHRTCDWIYAWEGCGANRLLISRGAIPFSAISEEGLDDMSRHWNSSRARQIDLFDLL